MGWGNDTWGSDDWGSVIANIVRTIKMYFTKPINMTIIIENYNDQQIKIEG